jgi:hypothetical protein
VCDGAFQFKGITAFMAIFVCIKLNFNIHILTWGKINTCWKYVRLKTGRGLIQAICTCLKFKYKIEKSTWGKINNCHIIKGYHNASENKTIIKTVWKSLSFYASIIKETSSQNTSTW